MKVVFINYPDVYTDDGHKIPLEMIEGHPKVGSELLDSDESSMYTIAAVTSDSDCVSGVCPIK